MFKLPSAGTEPGTLDSARKAMMPSIAKRPLLISVRSLESHESAEIETIAAPPRMASHLANAAPNQRRSDRRSSKFKEYSSKTPHA